jgi:hypothetical protein
MEPYASAFAALYAANAAKIDAMQVQSQRMNAGLSYGVRRSAAPGYVVGVPPAALDVQIAGTPTTGQNLTGQYTYFDPNGDPEGASTFVWKRAGVAIAGATAKTYALVGADENQPITFTVTPVSTVAPTAGPAKTSAAVTPHPPAPRRA